MNAGLTLTLTLTLILSWCAQSSVGEIPWKLLLSKPPVWALIISHFCHNWGTFILLTWMPTYYNQARRTHSQLQPFSRLHYISMSLSWDTCEPTRCVIDEVSTMAGTCTAV